MKRMKFIAIAASLAMLAGCANTEPKNAENSAQEMKKIGITQISDHPSLDNCRKGFIEGLKNKGYEEGKNIEIEYVSAQDDNSKNQQIAQNFASAKMDLVCGVATPSAQALYAACYEKDIPVIFNAVSDPVEAKLAVSETECMPGITGISDKLPVEEQLKMIREFLPEATKIGIMYSTGEANSVSTIAEYKAKAADYGFEIIESGISKKAEVPQAADVLLEKVDCISNMTDNTVVSALAVILDKAEAKGIPVFGSEEEQVSNGCVASAGLDYVKLGIQAGEIAGRVLDGEDISSIPFETLKESKITINKAACEKMNLAIPETLQSVAEYK